jgi:hypothetical protein
MVSPLPTNTKEYDTNSPPRSGVDREPRICGHGRESDRRKVPTKLVSLHRRCQSPHVESVHPAHQDATHERYFKGRGNHSEQYCLQDECDASVIAVGSTLSHSKTKPGKERE